MKKLALIVCLILMPVGNHLFAQEENEAVVLTDAQKIYGLSQFWQEAKNNFVYFDQVPDLDWDAAYQEYIPKVLEAKNTLEYYRLLKKFCALLKDGHTGITVPADARSTLGSPPVRLSAIEGKAIVTAIGVELQEALPPGSEVLKVDGLELSKHLEAHVYPFVSTSSDHVLFDIALIDNPYEGYGVFLGDIGTEVKIAFRTPDGKEQEMSFVREARNQDRKFINLRKRPPLFTFNWVEDGIAYVGLNSFGTPKIGEEFRKKLPELANAKGVIIDLRFNGGGATPYGMEILSHFTDVPLEGSKWLTREQRAVYRIWGRFRPQYEQYAKMDAWHEGEPFVVEPAETDSLLVPFVVLVSHFTGSAAEDFLIFLNGYGRATIVGQKSYGSTGQPLFFDLPGGGNARICVKKDLYQDGREFVGYGVEPDIPVEPTVASLLSGSDNVLEKGLQVLKEKINGK